MKKVVLLFVFSAIAFSGPVEAKQSIPETILSVKKEITLENQKLAELQQKNSAKRILQSEKLEKLEKELLPLREKKQTLKDVLWMKDDSYESLKEQTDILREEIQFAVSLLHEYRKDTEVRMSGSEIKHYEKRLAKVDSFLNLKESDQILDVLQPLLELAKHKSRKALGGTIYKGEVLDASGCLHKGQVLQVGPVEYFLDENEKVAGLLGIKLGSSTPALVYHLSSDLLSAVLKGVEKKLPVDTTLGEALKVKKYKKSWVAHIKAGGVTMVPILGLGLMCLITAVWKFMSLKKMNVKTDRTIINVIDLLSVRKIDAAKKEAEKIGLPVGTILLEGIEHHKASQEHIEEIMHEQIMSQLPYLEKHLNILSVAAAAAPLLGLLGTVTGMIHTFDMVAIFGTGKVNLLSGGISEALVTTEYGLIIAIPALLAHAYLARRVKKIVHTLEQTSVTFINGLHRKTVGKA